ncbi:MaoC family dehydratase [Amycolatopsis anabasis]|uniref:MaoC family dehydratase n=1 Tax=Amycolatopsis anabasis TaxID=1840409 RepID=UPI00131AE5E6|nr:MaoC family dehydratase [Amycolatopsis anabasis]
MTRSPRTLRAADVVVGTELPPLTIEATPTFVVSTALATRDFQDVHHDRDSAVARGSKDIFLNILTDTGLVQRYVTDWAGPEALVRSVKIRLGVPCYAYDTLTLSGRVTEKTGAELVVAISGRDSLGEHVTGTVGVTLPEERA